MPELPEVESMVRGLRPAMTGRTLRSITVHDPLLVHGHGVEEFERLTGGIVVDRVERRGKWVVISSGGDRGIIVIQPRMTGGFWLVSPPRPEHIRMTFRLDGSHEQIWFCDARRLGRMAWYSGPKDAALAFDRSHGPDALEIGRAALAERLTRTSRGIKSTLMDQKVLAGIGNIYADEILFRARLHPERVAAQLSEPEVDRLHAAVGEVLEEAIAAEGSSFDAGYRTVLGLEGGFLAINAMYGRGGKPCPSCKTAIQKVKIVGLIGRPTHFCPRCQPVRPPRRSQRR